jgi:hypothetical protein
MGVTSFRCNKYNTLLPDVKGRQFYFYNLVKYARRHFKNLITKNCLSSAKLNANQNNQRKNILEYWDYCLIVRLFELFSQWNISFYKG